MLEELAEEIGIEPALRLCAAWPGLRLRVPKEMAADHPIALQIGFEPARKLAAIYGGEEIVVPMGKQYAQRLVKQRAIEAYRAGTPASEVCRQHGVHLFTLYRWIGDGHRKNQIDLF